jgi:cation diffusion facilitator CzcD-associated flavoprotein CzcO
VAEHFDVVIVGAGISGVGAAWHLQQNSPDRSYVVLEGRERLGGTWDLFRYPGIRSDSDMFTLGFSFRPWTDSKAIADGPSILNYLDEAVSDYGIDKHIRYSTRVIGASWSSADAQWTVTAQRAGETLTFTCTFLFLCTGYYNYERGHTPDFAGMADFKGRIVHPQFWTPAPPPNSSRPWSGSSPM